MGDVAYSLRESAAFITLDRPQKRNAINAAMLAELDDAVRRAQREARVIVLAGNGPCFCAGLDLAEHLQRDAEAVFRISRDWHRVLGTIRRGGVPALAVLHGAVVGGGLEIAAACHLRLADPTTFFALPEGERGIFVGGGASVHVARLIGASRMTDMMLTGRTLSALEGERAGLVNYLEAAGAAGARAEALALKVARVAPLTIVGILDALPRIQDMSEEDGLFVESLMVAMAQTGSAAGSRMGDFTAKRGEKVAHPGDDL